MSIVEKMERAWREMVCARPVGAGDGDTYTVEAPTREGFRKAIRTATGLTDQQLEVLANGTMVVISRQSLTEMHAALIACDEDGMTEHAECMVEAGALVNRAMLAAKEG